MKRGLSLIISFAMMLSVFFTMGITVNAETALKPITIYAIEEWASKYISIPSDHPKKYQISISGETIKSCTADSSDSIKVSNSGLITPSVTHDYKYDTTKVTVQTNKSTYTVDVTLKDYAQEYAEKEMKKYISKNITNSMTGEEKLDKIAKYVASFNYDANFSGGAGMIISGGGDCWASTDLVIAMCKIVGIDAWSRDARRDPGAGSGHVNAMAKADGKYYMIEAGYDEKAPRFYSIVERTSLYSVDEVSGGVSITSYDGKPDEKTITVPSTIDGKKVVAIGSEAFASRDIEKITLPDSLKSISEKCVL